MKATLALATAGLIAMPTSISAQTTTPFSIDDTAYEFEVPEGYCVPTGEAIELNEYLASLDPENDTLVNVDRCGTFGEDYMQVKVPKVRQPILFPRSVFLRILAVQFQTEAGKEALDQSVDDANDELAEGSEGAITVAQSAVRYWGKDDLCLYLQGASQVESFGQSGWIYYAACFTLIGKNAISVNTYGPLADPNKPASGLNLELTYKRLRAQSQAAAQTISVRE